MWITKKRPMPLILMVSVPVISGLLMGQGPAAVAQMPLGQLDNTGKAQATQPSVLPMPTSIANATQAQKWLSASKPGPENPKPSPTPELVPQNSKPSVDFSPDDLPLGIPLLIQPSLPHQQPDLLNRWLLNNFDTFRLIQLLEQEEERQIEDRREERRNDWLDTIEFFPRRSDYRLDSLPSYNVDSIPEINPHQFPEQ